MLRSTKFFKRVQVERPNRQSVVTPTDQLVDNVHELAQTILAPAIQQRSKNAVTVDRISVRYYQQIATGRLCSCFKKEYDNPEMHCPVCFGGGRVGGYNVFGTSLTVVDATYPSLTTLNVTMNDEVWPWSFELVEGSLEGYVEAIIDVPSLLDVDVIKLYRTGNYIKVTVRKQSELCWHTLSRSSLLSLAASKEKLVIRVTLSRKCTEDVTPSFTHLYLRYKLITVELYVDMPRPGELRNADNFDLTGLQTTQAFFPATLPRSKVGDIFKDLRNEYFWRITEVTVNNPLGILTSWDVNVRAVESFEIFAQLP